MLERFVLHYYDNYQAPVGLHLRWRRPALRCLSLEDGLRPAGAARTQPLPGHD